ncbi:polysaccharide biosynthesis tyrosine autokinase [Demetria terragena]|uniref:polysaccharide biosynthesis tyrosine autokinase n=1 Tax=Demetria terragena TaxID=63959 RepID=UPI00036FEDB8|nr:polysaccharide biosynthesis tyrosine autokinase [Demetria terragena]
MTLREFFTRIWASRRLVLVVLLLVVGAAAVATATAPRTYTATARAYLAAQGGESAGALSRQDLQTYTEVLSSPTVLQPLRERLGLPSGTPIQVSATLADTASILEIQAQASDPKQAAALANETPEVLAEVAPQFTSLLAGGATVRSSMIEPASVPDRPSSPAVVRTMTLAVLAGLVLGVCAALLRSALDTRARTVEHLEEQFDAPVLAEVPKTQPQPDLTREPYGPHAEAIRRLRTNVRFIDVTRESGSLVITSPHAGDGKTTVAISLAQAMARDGRRVLLVDGDLRKSDVGRLLDLDDSVGVTSVLVGETMLDDVVQQWEGTSLYVLPAGPQPPNAAELLGSSAMRQLFTAATSAFDFVILDSPPLVPVVDALLIERLAGNLLLVVAADKTSRRDMQSARRSLETVNAHLSGTVLNYAQAPAGYGYGYGSQPKKKRSRKTRKATH